MPTRHRRSAPPGEFEDPLEIYEPETYEDPLEEALCESAVTEVHTTPVSMVLPDTSVEDVMLLMQDRAIASVLVVEDEKLVGIFTERDVLNKVTDSFERVRLEPIRAFMTPTPVAVYETDNVATALCAVAVGSHPLRPGSHA